MNLNKGCTTSTKAAALFFIFCLAIIPLFALNQITVHSKNDVLIELESVKYEMNRLMNDKDDIIIELNKLNTQKDALEIKYRDEIQTLENKITELTSTLEDKKEEIETLQLKIPVKNVYLTFDDGPSSVTLKILDVLKEENVKATFFVNGSKTEIGAASYKRIVEEGHIIGNHTYSHNYTKIYRSADAFYDDIVKLEDLIRDVTNTIPPKIFRFPGGSNIKKSSNTILKEIKEMMSDKGYVYFDWNCGGDDAIGSYKTSNEIFNRVIETGGNREHIIVLLHMNYNNSETAKALPKIIEYYREKGYTFEVLHQDSYTCQFP